MEEFEVVEVFIERWSAKLHHIILDDSTHDNKGQFMLMSFHFLPCDKNASLLKQMLMETLRACL